MFKKFFLDKKALILIAVIVIIGIVVWLTSAKPKQETTEPLIEGQQPAEQPITETSSDQISLVVENLNYYQFYSSGLYFFRSDDNSFYRRLPETNELMKIHEIRGLASNQVVFEVVFCPQEPKAIVKISSRQGVINRIIDLIEKEEDTLAAKIIQPQWLDSNRIVYLYSQDQSRGFLSLLNLQTDQWHNLKRLAANPVELKVSQEKLFLSHLTGFQSDLFYLISTDLSGKEETKIDTDIYGFLPSPKGDQVALLNPQEGLGILVVKDLSSNDMVETDLKITGADKLGWQDNNKLLVAANTTGQATGDQSESLVVVTVPGGATETIWEADQARPVTFREIKVFQDQTYFLHQQSLYQISSQSQ